MTASNHGRNQYNLELWEIICKVSMGIHLQARAGEFRFLTGEEKWNDWKEKKYYMYWSPLYPGKTLLKSKGGTIRFSDMEKYLTWLKLQECKQFSRFWITEMICILNSSVYQKSLLEKWHVIISNQGKPFAHWSEIAVSIRDRLQNSSFNFSKSTHPLSDWVCIVQ